MNILLLGAAGFIGTNLAIKLAQDINNKITVVDVKKDYFSNLANMALTSILIKESAIDIYTDFEELLAGQDIVYHLVSTTVPTTSNQHIEQELTANVVMTAKLLQMCVKCGVKKVVFISSGGTVYGKDVVCPIKEDAPTWPINSYGVQKVTIEKLLFLYNHMYGLDYRIVRLANPYGPYQRPNGILGAVTTFTYRALKGETISVYGDGSVVRDFIYIDNAIEGILNVAAGDAEQKLFNVGCGHGTSIKQVLDTIQEVLKRDLLIEYTPARGMDVPQNYLDISRYESVYGKMNTISLKEGIRRTADFLQDYYRI